MFTWRGTVAFTRRPTNVGRGSTNFGIDVPASGVWSVLLEAWTRVSPTVVSVATAQMAAIHGERERDDRKRGCIGVPPFRWRVRFAPRSRAAHPGKHLRPQVFSPGSHGSAWSGR